MSESKAKSRKPVPPIEADDAACVECDTAARLGLSSEQGEAVTRDASRAMGHDLSLPDIEAAAKIFSLLGDAGRLQLVLRCMEKPQTVSELAEAANMSQSLCSHHLRHLRDQRILTSERRGRHIFYQIDDDHISHVVRDTFAHVTHD
ncbi:ArsR/SmtB family transcription factor [Thalassospira australica]|uniref:ArsR/SmtB family transcription factor n=1 Tax=Thalassospira australica TaxID=1528106 RepID=UPI000689548F|nr:metalloregulator ArsR/SmtB family transcription factor [Thalassospira australica]